MRYNPSDFPAGHQVIYTTPRGNKIFAKVMATSKEAVAEGRIHIAFKFHPKDRLSFATPCLSKITRIVVQGNE